jgi:hypothetical protein
VPEKERESRGTRVVAWCVAAAAVLAVPIALFDLYGDVSSLSSKVDYQAEQLDVQKGLLAAQEEQIVLQKAQLEQQNRQFLELRNMTAPHIADEEVAARLDRLDQDIDRAASQPGFASIGAQRTRVDRARALYDDAVRAWNGHDYEAAGADIDAAYDALAGRPSDPSGPAALANQALAASLQVRRLGSNNTLSWADVSGEDGYQVWRHESPFVLVATLPAGATGYQDKGASPVAAYLVTAVVGGQKLTAADVNGGDVPGYAGVPAGESPVQAAGYVPALGPGLVAGLLGLAAIAARRRLR